ncbi:MAG: hypothetical protein HS100_22755 [Anaerolineales bacterium]|nr:hypothetical protein [Anaerolineales bacterium]
MGSGFWFKKFRVKLAQVSKIGFVVLRQVFASKRFHFANSVFSGLRFVWSSQVSEIGYISLAKVLASLVRAFSPGSFFRQFCFSAKSVFSKGFSKFFTLRFGKSVMFSKIKVGLVKN